MSEPITMTEALRDFSAPRKSAHPMPAPRTYRLTREDIEGTLPHEYRKAVPLDAVREVVRQAIRTLEVGGSALIVGPPGTGKTFQLYGLLRSLRMKMARPLIDDGEVIRWDLRGDRTWKIESQAAWTERRLREVVASGRLAIISESTDIRRARYDRPMLDSWCANERVLAIDDVGCVEPSEWVREAIYEIATQRRKSGLTTIWTTNLGPDELRKTFGGAIASRLLGGHVVEIGGKDRRL